MLYSFLLYVYTARFSSLNVLNVFTNKTLYLYSPCGAYFFLPIFCNYYFHFFIFSIWKSNTPNYIIILVVRVPYSFNVPFNGETKRWRSGTGKLGGEVGVTLMEINWLLWRSAQPRLDTLNGHNKRSANHAVGVIEIITVRAKMFRKIFPISLHCVCVTGEGGQGGWGIYTTVNTFYVRKLIFSSDDVTKVRTF